MALIADLCPNCQRVTRCQVVERGSVVGGLIFGVPFVLPSSSVSCACGECGCDFKSQTWDYQKALSPDEAMSLDVEAILSLTNPALEEQLALSSLKAVPELGEAFHPASDAVDPPIVASIRIPAAMESGRNCRTLDRWPLGGVGVGITESHYFNTNLQAAEGTGTCRMTKIWSGLTATGKVTVSRSETVWTPR